MGDVLAGGGILQLDHRPMDSRFIPHERSVRRAGPRTRVRTFLGLLLRTVVGRWWAHLRPHHAVSRPVARNGRSTWALRCFWHSHAPNLSWRIHDPGCGDFFRPRDSVRNLRLSRWDYRGWPGGHFQRARYVTRAAASHHKGV